MKKMIQNSLFALSILSLNAFSTEPAAEKTGWLTDAQDALISKVYDEVADFKIGFTAKLFDLSIVDGVKASLAYTYQLEPSYNAGYYSRIDSWKLKEDIRPGDIIQNALKSKLPVFLNISNGNEVIFIRHYKDKLKAATAIPYTPIHLPLTASLARSNLNPGDFVAIPAEMNLIVGADVNIPLIKPGILSLNAKAGASFLVSGHFQLQIMRMEDDKVQMKIIALRKKQTSENAGIGWELNIFEIPAIKDLNIAYPASLKTGVKIIDGLLEDILIDAPKNLVNHTVNSIFEETVINLSMTQNNGTLFEIDYVFDLKNPEAAKAYNEILNSTARFKPLKLFNSFLTDKFGEQKEAYKILVTDLDSVEKIVQEDKLKDPSQKRVERLFKGQNNFNTSSHGWKLGAVFYRASESTTGHEDLITYFNLENEKNNVLYLSNSKNKSRGFIFDLLKEDEYFNNFFLFNVNEQKELKNDSLTDLGFNYSMSDRMMTEIEQVQFQMSVKKLLAEKIYLSIPWDKMITRKAYQKNININFQVLFDRRIIELMSALSYEEIVEHMQEYNQETKTFSDKEIIRVATLMRECLTKMENEKEESKDRINKIIKLQRQNIFTKYGPRLIFSLLNDEQISKYVYFRINWGSMNVQPIQHTFGTNPLSELFPIFQRMQFLIDQGHFNLKFIEFDPNLAHQ